jgi:hypothetical protein
MRAEAMKRVLGVARLVLVVSGALVLLLGLLIWSGNGDQLIGVHVVLACVLVLALWVIAYLAAMAGVPRRMVTVTVAWSLFIVVFGLNQERLVEGEWHWTIQLLHLVLSMTLLASGQALVSQVHRRETAVLVSALSSGEMNAKEVR